MRNIFWTNMGKQINLYIAQKDIEKIQKYLRERNFVLLKDQLSLRPEPLYAQNLLTIWESTGYVTFKTAHIAYQSFEQEGQQKFRIDSLKSEIMTCTFFDKKKEIYRMRFYYPNNFMNIVDEKKHKNPEFGLCVDRFFRWLRRQYKSVPDMPTFYYNPVFPPKEWF